MADVSLNSSGVHVQVAVEEWPGFVLAHRTKDGTLEYSGFCIDLLNILAESLNFSYTLVRSPDGQWGDRVNGTWTGMLGMLVRQEADMAMLLAPTAERAAFVDWSVPFDYWYHSVAVKRELGSHSLYVFLGPFHWMMYVYIAMAFVVFISLYLAVDLVERRLLASKRRQDRISNLIVAMFGFLLNKAMEQLYTGPVTRSMVALWCVLGLVLTASYTCKLTSLLVNVPSPPPFTSLAEMVSRDDFRWGILPSEILFSAMQDSKNAVEKAVYRGLMRFAQDDPEVLSGDPDVQLRKVLSGSYAFLSEGQLLNRWASQHCEIAIVAKKIIGLRHYTVFLPKSSPWKRHINRVILRLEQSGSLVHLRRRWFPSQLTCDGQLSPTQTISLSTVQGPFYMTLAGVALATCFLLLERFIHQMRSSVHVQKNATSVTS